MTWLNVAYNNFIGGEVSSDMYGRFDLEVYKKSASALINFLIRPQGPVFFRPGLKFVATTRLNKPAIIRKFVFNAGESYILEFTDSTLRFYRNQKHVTEADKPITGVSKEEQCVITAAAHGYEDGDEVYLYDIIGQNRLNGKSYIVSDKTTDTFKIKDSDGNYISTVDMPDYVSGGVASRIYELAIPYKEEDILSGLQLAQNADTVYIAHHKYQPQKLTRTDDTNWEIKAATGTNFPFTSEGNYPRSVAFAQGRLWYGGTDNAPDKFWGSKAPKDDGTPQYDDFTTGADADNAVVYSLATSGGKVEDIRWIRANNKYLVIGTLGGILKVTGSTDSEAVTPTSVNVRSLSSNGAKPCGPITLGNSIYYVQRDGIVIREIYYDVYQDAYVAENRQLTASKISGTGVKQLEYTAGRLDTLWGLREDGALISMTVNKSENIYGWQRQRIGGDPIIENIASLPQSNWDDQIWVVANRTIDGKVRRYVEYMVNEVRFPERVDFFAGDMDSDEQRYNNAMFMYQQKYAHLDSHLSYDGTNNADTLLLTYEDDGTLTIQTKPLDPEDPDDPEKDDPIPVKIFNASDVGRQIWGTYDSNGIGGGRYEITEYVSETEVKCEILSDADVKVTELTPGSWQITTDVVSGLDHLEGETVQVIADGGVHPDVVVTDGKITLEAQHATAHIGYGYTGILQSLNVEGGGINGPAQCKQKRIVDLGVRMLHTLGAEVGTSLYNTEQVLYASTSQYTGRPPIPFTGIKKIPVQDEWVGETADDTQTQVVVIQKYPLPCEIQMIDAIMETVNE